VALTEFVKMGFATFSVIKQFNGGSVVNVVTDLAILIKQVDDNTDANYAHS
jgi:hypothetical protein